MVVVVGATVVVDVVLVEVVVVKGVEVDVVVDGRTVAATAKSAPTRSRRGSLRPSPLVSVQPLLPAPRMAERMLGTDMSLVARMAAAPAT